MKKILLILFVFIFGTVLTVQAAAPILYPQGGGTGISTAPIYGQMLVGNSSGTYTLTATSSLGISGGSGGGGGNSKWATSTVPTSIYPNGATKVGVGTTSPWATLSVSSVAQQDGTLSLFNIASTTNASLLNVLGNGNIIVGTTNPLYWDATNKWLGIGTSTPFVPLTVNSSATTQAVFFSDAGASSNGGALINIGSTQLPTAADQRLGAFTFADRANGTTRSSAGIFGFSSQTWVDNSNQGTYLTFATTPNNSTSRTNVAWLREDGKFGLGTSTPSAMLAVSGGGFFNGNLTAANITATGTLNVGTDITLNNGKMYFSDASDYITNLSNLGLLEIYGAGQAALNSGNIQIAADANNSAAIIYTGATELFRVGVNGRMGLSTSTPLGMLSAQGNTTDLLVLATSTQNTVFGVDKDGHRFTSGPLPAISSCGTGTGTVVGDDSSGTITTATAATACTMTFAKAYAGTPTCTVTDNSLVGFADVSSISTSAVTFGISSALTGGNLYYNCQYHR